MHGPTLRQRALVSCCICILCWLGSGSLAPVQAALAKSRFYLEHVEVIGLESASPEALLSTARLHDGQSVDEDTLRTALHRIVRLPFVVTANLSLGRGSQRGTYVLRIHVVEVEHFFFTAEIQDTVYSRPLALESGERDSSFKRQVGSVGYRRFIGRHTEVFGGVGQDSDLIAGVSRYDLGSRGIVGTLAASYVGEPLTLSLPLGLDPLFATWNPDSSTSLSARLLIPLSGERAFRLSYSQQLGLSGGLWRPVALPDPSTTVEMEDFVYRSLGAEVLTDSTDDPIFPTRGRVLTGQLEVQTMAARLHQIYPVQEEPEAWRREARLWRSVLTASRYLPLAGDRSVGLSLRLAAGRSHVRGLARGPLSSNSNVFEGSVSLRFLQRLWPRSGLANRSRELWLDGMAGVGWEELSPTPVGAPDPLRRGFLRLGVAFRHAWGLYRFQVSWVDLGGLP